MKHPRVYALADFLDVSALKTLACKKLKAGLDSKFVVVGFSRLVKEVYSSTNLRDNDIRDVLVEATTKNFGALKSLPSFKEVANEFGEFSGGVLMVIAPELPTDMRFRCQICNTVSDHCSVYCGECGYYGMLVVDKLDLLGRS